MKCFCCQEEITPETNYNANLDGTFDVSAWCPMCGASVKMYERESENPDAVFAAFERACRE